MALKTIEQRVAYLVSQVPAAQENYKLLLLLYWQVFDGISIPPEVVNEIIQKGAEPESLGRLKRKTVQPQIEFEDLVAKIKAAMEEVNENAEGSNSCQD